MRAVETFAIYGYDEETGEQYEEYPAYLGQQLDYDIVGMLTRACPEALTSASPMNILCRGCAVSLELAHLLTDEEQKCCEVDDDKQNHFPMRSLLGNEHVDSFPTDVFRYFMECSPSSLRRRKPVDYDEDDGFGSGTLSTDTLLHVACSNPKISVEAIQIIIKECPYMVKEEYAYDGFLPLHNLCCNGDLDDESSIEILKILVNAFPESVRTNVGVANSLPDWFSRERGENVLPIHYACGYNSFDFCRYLLEMYPGSVSKKQLHYSHEVTDNGSLMLPFHLACKYGSLDLVQYLLEQYPEALGEQTSDRNYNCDEKKGRYTTVRYSESNASLLQGGNYPLHLAASREHSPEKMEIVNFLLQQDVDAVSNVGKYGNLPLHRACWYPSGPDINIIEHLVQVYPAAIHTKNIFGQLPIHLAMQTSDKSNFEGLTFLAQQQPDVLSSLDERGMCCAHYACSSKNAVKKLELITELCPEAFRCQSDSCGLPIHHACTNGCNEEVLQNLIAQYPESLGVHVGSLGSPLHCVKKKKKIMLLRFLLKEKYRTDVENGLPLVHALLQDDDIQDKDQILALRPFTLDERAEEDDEGRTLSHLIFRFTKDVELISFLCTYPRGMISKQDRDGWLPLHHAMRHDASPETVRFLLNTHPEHVLVTDKDGRTPLHVASRRSKWTAIKVLLEGNPELIRVSDNNGRTALHHACKYGRSKNTIARLLEGNMDLIEMNDNKGRSILHAACCRKNIFHASYFNGSRSKDTSLLVVRYLVDEVGCDIAAVDSRGDLPLHKVCRTGNSPVVEYLMEKDMTAVYARNNSNELPIHVLSNRSGKEKDVFESIEYTEAVLKLLLAYPETVDVA
jgi:ankyrin repeat protein